MSDNINKDDKIMKLAFWNSILGFVLGLIVFFATFTLVNHLLSPLKDVYISGLISLILGTITFFVGHTTKARKESWQKLHDQIKTKAEREEVLQMYKTIREDVEKKADEKDFKFVQATLENIHRTLEFNHASHQELENKITEIYQMLINKEKNQALESTFKKKGK